MCTYVTNSTTVRGSGKLGGDWFPLDKAVVYFDHPQSAPVDHAMCIDFTAASGDAASRVAVELDAASARRLAEAILATLDAPEVVELAVEG
jgi:hypothetical protein